MSSSAPTTSAADRGFTWSDEETSVLLQLWSNVHAQANDLDLNGNKKNINIFEKVSEEMNRLGFSRTTSQCKEKVKRMKREYTVTKQRNQSGRKKKTMRFFELFEQILQTIQSKNSENTVTKKDSSDKEYVVKKNISHTETNLIPPRNLRKRKQPVETEDIHNPWSPDVVIVEEETQPPPSSDSKSGFSSVKNDKLSEKVQALDSSCTSLPFFKTMMSSVSLKFMKYQTELEDKMICRLEELENERNAMDERIKRMWVDFEERRQRDETEHELKLMSSLQNILKPAQLTEQK